MFLLIVGDGYKAYAPFFCSVPFMNSVQIQPLDDLMYPFNLVLLCAFKCKVSSGKSVHCIVKNEASPSCRDESRKMETN